MISKGRRNTDETSNGNGGANASPDLFQLANDLIARLKSSPSDQRQAILDQINAAFAGKRGRKHRLRAAGDYQNDVMFSFAVNYLWGKQSANRNEVAASYAKTPGAMSFGKEGLYARFSKFWSQAKRAAEQNLKTRALLNEIDAAIAAGAAVDEDEPLDEFLARIRGKAEI